MDTVNAVACLVPFAAFTRQCQADQTPAKAGHEIDGIRVDMVGRQHQIAFVFAVFFINQDDDTARAKFGDDILDR